MNQPKKMTKRQEEYVLANGLKSDEWFFLEEDDKFLLIVRKATGKSRWILKKREISLPTTNLNRDKTTKICYSC